MKKYYNIEEILCSARFQKQAGLFESALAPLNLPESLLEAMNMLQKKVRQS